MLFLSGRSPLKEIQLAVSFRNVRFMLSLRHRMLLISKLCAKWQSTLSSLVIQVVCLTIIARVSVSAFRSTPTMLITSPPPQPFI